MQLVEIAGQWYLHTHRMHGRSVSDSSYIARILGSDKQYRYKREFLRPTCNARNSEQWVGPLIKGVLYEYRRICPEGESGYAYRKYGGFSGVLRFEIEDEDGCWYDLSVPETLAAVAELDRANVRAKAESSACA